MGRARILICPRCRVRPKEPKQGYCKPCRHAYWMAYKLLGTTPAAKISQGETRTP